MKKRVILLILVVLISACSNNQDEIDIEIIDAALNEDKVNLILSANNLKINEIDFPFNDFSLEKINEIENNKYSLELNYNDLGSGLVNSVIIIDISTDDGNFKIEKEFEVEFPEKIVESSNLEKQSNQIEKNDAELKIPSGRQRYFIRSNPKSPQIYEAIIDPLDVHVGDTQTMIIKAHDKVNPITSVTAAIETDKGIRTESLKLTEELSKGRTIWEGSWIVKDTHSATYRTTFTAANSIGETASTTLTWTDPCAPPNSGDWTLDDDCTITGVDGVDAGNFTVETYTLTLNSGASWVFNPGMWINVTSGTIAISTGGNITQTNLWVKDTDSDDYGDSDTGQVAQDDSPGAGYVRRNTLVNTITDCDDDDATKWRDRWSDNSDCKVSTEQCVGNHAGYQDSEGLASFTVFVTSTTYSGDFGTTSSADSSCNTRASAGSLSGSYTAWVSEGTSDEPRDRGLSPCASAGANSISWEMTNGWTLVDDWNDLTDGTIDQMLQRTELGGVVDDAERTFTGTTQAGAATSVNCNGWTVADGSYSATGGRVDVTNYQWTDWSAWACISDRHFYCFQHSQ
tara:strand:- start:1571 stop:3283 length:1713 start_codon:yes stop_codon:yes gene_type:complete